MSEPLPVATTLREGIARVRWALAIARSTNPALYYIYWSNALIGTLFPAGIALSVRGLVNAVSASLADASRRDPGTIYLWLSLGFTATLGMVVTGALSRHLARRFALDLQYRLHQDVLHHACAMSYVRFEDPQFHDALKRAQDTPERHVAQVLSSGLDLLTKSVQIASLLLILVAIEPILFILLLPIAVPYLVFQWRQSRRQFDEIDARVEKQRWIGYYTGTLANDEQAAEIRLLGLGPVLIERASKLLAEFRALLLAFQRSEFLGNLVFSLLSVIAVYLAMTRATFSIIDGRLTIGDLAIYGSAATQLRSLVESGIALAANLRWQVLLVGNVRGFLLLEPDASGRTGTRRATLAGAVKFCDVSFAYPGNATPALSRVSFAIAPGETVALVGDNGAGKTTIAKLIAGLYEPSAGSVRFDGIDARELDLGDRQRQVSCLFQNFGRYAATASDNIAFGDWPRLAGDDSGIEAVAKARGVHELIEAMPQGYRTLLGRVFGSFQPSGGQWQQIAIARAMARDAPILILDEPTANLDIDTEYRLFMRFRDMAKGRSVLLISHRFSTVLMADRILVLEAGQVIESGTHDELLELGGRYATLYDLHRRHLVAT